MTETRTTIRDVADAAGVSIPTVSKVLNGRHDVSAQTRAKVERAIARTSYRRRVATRPSARARLIELVIHEADSAWGQEIIKGVDAVCSRARMGLVLTQLGGAHRPPQEWVSDVSARRPLGVILVLTGLDAEQHAQVTSRGIPYVVVDTDGQPPANVPAVGSNNWSGGLAATRHLVSLGHTRIGVISGPPDVLCSRARVDGYRTAHDESAVQVDLALVRWGDFTAVGGYRCARELLTLPHRPTAIFAGSDHQALGVLRAAHELGLEVPRDLSVVGYDDLALAEWSIPRLTTVHQPLREMSLLATMMLLELAGEGGVHPARVELPTELVVRDSTAMPVP